MRRLLNSSGEEDVERQEKQGVRFVYVIVETEKQIMLIERNVSVFPKIFKCAYYIESYLRDRMRNFDFTVNLRELPSPKRFWNYVDEAEDIFELTMTMNAPNMALFAGEETADLLRQVKDSVNNEEISITVRNRDGLLRLTRRAIGNYIRYIQQVGGKYSLKIRRNNVEEVKTSQDDIARTFIKRSKATEAYDEDELNNIHVKIELLNSIENRDEAGQEDSESTGNED